MLTRKEILALPVESRRIILEKEVRLYLYRSALEKWGVQSQINQLYEEIGELLTAIVHLDRGRITVDGLAEEIADVELCLEQLKDIHKISEAVESWKEKKLKRLAERLGE